jgi:hypothetical protein
MTLAPGTKLGPYEILAPLGEGGMGEVYKAVDTRLDRPVAIKTLRGDLTSHPSRLERFRREARAISRLNHPHICALYDVGQHEGIEFLVMELLDGDTLQDRLGTGPLRLQDALQYAAQMADALDAAHRHSIVHRDLKPGNVMLTSAGVKLLDFGLAREAYGASPASRVSRQPGAPAETTDQSPPTVTAPLTADGVILGTYPYMAPEQLDGRDTDARTDIFALGSVLYEMLTGRRAFEGRSQMSVVAAILEKDPLPLSGSDDPDTRTFSAAVERVVLKCLQKNPDDRWQTARDLASELRWIVTGEATGVSRTSTRSGARRLMWAAAVAAIGLAAVGIPAALLTARQPAEPTRFLVFPPEGQSLGNDLAVAPNGRSVAFVVVGRDGVSRIAVQEFRETEARVLTDTPNAREPFWSPDGRRIGFFADGSLETILVSGGSPERIAKVSSVPGGGSWGSDGTILYGFAARAAGGVIYRVKATGSNISAPVTNLQTETGETGHLFPRFLPDGHHFLFTVSGSGRPTVWIGTLGTLDRQRLLDMPSTAAAVEPGYLLFQRAGVLQAQTFSLSRTELSGDPISLPQRVTDDIQNATFDARGGTLASITSGVTTRLLTWIDRKGQPLSSVSGSEGIGNPALSPDETLVVGTKDETDLRRRTLWLFDLRPGGAGPQALAEGSPMAVWSRDGTAIAYGRDGVFYRRSMSDASEQRLAPAGSMLLQDWYGQTLLYTRIDATTLGDLWMLPLVGDMKPRTLVATPNNEGTMRVSPDGHWIAYASNDDVYVRSFPPTGSDPIRISTQGGRQPQWRGDGTELFYLTNDNRLVAVPVTLGETFVAGRPSPLFPVRVAGNARNHYVPTRDGQQFLFNWLVEGSRPHIDVVLNWTAALSK